MSSIRCGNGQCKYNKGTFCGNDFAFLNHIGQCKVWFDDNGQWRGAPLYPAEEMSKAREDNPIIKNEGEEAKIENESVNADSAKKDEGEKEI